MKVLRRREKNLLRRKLSLKSGKKRRCQKKLRCRKMVGRRIVKS